MASDPPVNFRFSDVLELPVRNGLYKPKEFHGRGARIVNMGELFGNPRLADIEMRRLDVTEAELKRHDVREGDLLFARRSLVAEGAGRCSLVTKVSEPTVFESSIIRARPDPRKVSSEYLFYLFSSPTGRDLMRSIARQMAVSGITGSDLSDLQIPLPSPATQRSIAAFLSLLDDRIDLLRQTNATLEAIAQALFKSWFVDFDPVRAKAEGREPEGIDAATAAHFPGEFEESELGLIPKGWKVLPLSEAFEINPRRSIRKGSVAPYLDMASVPTSGHVPAPPVDREFSSGSKFQNGDTLLARITPCLENGKTAHVDFLADEQIGWGSTEFIVLRPRSPLPLYFGYLIARHDSFRAFSIQAMTGTSGRQRVELGQLERFKFVCPDDPVSSAFGLLVEPIRASISANQQRSEVLAKLRDTLLPRLISGKLRLPEAEKAVEDALA
jgi:type I restriction enzyme S subunit